MIKKALWCAKIMVYGLAVMTVVSGYAALVSWSQWFLLILATPVLFVMGLAVETFVFKKEPPFDI